MIRRRLAAIAALALGLVALGLLIVLAITDARRGVLTVYVLVGLQGAGKTTWAATHATRLGAVTVA